MSLPLRELLPPQPACYRVSPFPPTAGIKMKFLKMWRQKHIVMVVWGQREDFREI